MIRYLLSLILETFSTAPRDTSLSCVEIIVEMSRAQDVIDAIKKDREDLSGKDVLDGVLWFPFNLIAKSGNYPKATKAASARIKRLENLKKEKNCA